MAQTKDIVRQAPAVAITVGVLTLTFGGGLGAQAPPQYGCLMGTACVVEDQGGHCGYRSSGGSDYCSCFGNGVYLDTWNCSTS
jgi:hypothetical protein